MIKPINKHVLIEPLKRDDFIPTNSGQYQEIGEIIALASELKEEDYLDSSGLNVKGTALRVGYKVLFDAWLAKKYPKEGSRDEYYWLVRYEDIVAYEE